jgi:hypothetical protein
MMHPMFAWPPAASDRPAARPSAAERDLAERDEHEVHDDHDRKRRGIWKRRRASRMTSPRFAHPAPAFSTGPPDPSRVRPASAAHRRTRRPARKAGACFATLALAPERRGVSTAAIVQRRYLSVESMQLILAAGWTEENSLEQQHQQEVAELNAA